MIGLIRFGRLDHPGIPIVILSTLLVPMTRAQEVDPAAIRKALEESWRSIRTLEAHGVQYVADSRGERTTRPGVTSSTFDFHHAPGARRALKIQYFGPDGAFKHGEDCREDGRKIYRLRPFRRHADLIDEMMIAAQQDTVLAQRDMLNSIFVWCWTPAGRALYTLLDQNSRYETVRDAEGRSLVRVTIPQEGLVLDLDSSVGYSPRIIRLDDDVQFTVTKFEQLEGVWLPTRGFESRPKSASPVLLRHEGFEVVQIRVNAPIPESTFTLAKPPKGALISDRMTGKNRVQGGVAARTALYKSNPVLGESPVESAKPVPTVPSIQASTPLSLWPLLLFAASGLFLGGSWILKNRLG